MGAKRIAVLENITNHTNIGALFRSAAALNIDAIILNQGCCDPLYRRAIRVSMGTVFQVPWTRTVSDRGASRTPERSQKWPKGQGWGPLRPGEIVGLDFCRGMLYHFPPARALYQAPLPCCTASFQQTVGCFHIIARSCYVCKGSLCPQKRDGEEKSRRPKPVAAQGFAVFLSTFPLFYKK